MAVHPCILILLVVVGSVGGGEAVRVVDRWESVIKQPTESSSDVDGEVGTRWAVLVAGSSGYGNYRHQVGLVLFILIILLLII